MSATVYHLETIDGRLVGQVEFLPGVGVALPWPLYLSPESVLTLTVESLARSMAEDQTIHSTDFHTAPNEEAAAEYEASYRLIRTSKRTISTRQAARLRKQWQGA